MTLTKWPLRMWHIVVIFHVFLLVIGVYWTTIVIYITNVSRKMFGKYSILLSKILFYSHNYVIVYIYYNMSKRGFEEIEITTTFKKSS